MKKLFIHIGVFIGMSIQIIAQEQSLSTSINVLAEEKSNKELKGDKYAFRYSFDKAIETYENTKQLTSEGQRNLAESYSNLNQNIESEITYSKLINSQSGVLPEDYYNYAMVLKTNGKYVESHTAMDKFNELNPSDLRAKSYMASKAEFAGLLVDDGKYKIEHLKINTDADDFGTSFYQNRIVFASTRANAKIIKRKYNWNGKPFLNLYVSDLNGSELKKPKNFDKSLNGKMHDGTASFSSNGMYMAFTRNNNQDKSPDKVVELQIWFSSYQKGKWSKPEAFVFNNNEYSVGQPYLTSNGNTMYFTSDMPSGYGGADLYKVTKDEKGSWSKPENLGDKINTEGDEMFPFLEEKSGMLYFSSNGRFGLGGLDIFISPVNGSSFGTAYNACAPLNTRCDDFALIVDGNTNKGYFSSNRIGGSGDDDIYSVDFLNVSKLIQGIAKDKNDHAIPKTFITLFDEKGNAIDTLTTNNNAAYTFSVDKDKNYKLVGKKENYLDGYTVATTFGKELVIIADVVLLEKEKAIAVIEAKADLGVILKLNSIYFDLDKYNIRSDAGIELNKIVKIMNEHPNMVVELGAHTDCRETEAYNQVLSDKRAKASTDYIKNRITKPSRISGKGYGKTKLVNECACEGDVVSSCSEEEHQKNRRTEFIILTVDSIVKK